MKKRIGVFIAAACFLYIILLLCSGLAVAIIMRNVRTHVRQGRYSDTVSTLSLLSLPLNALHVLVPPVRNEVSLVQSLVSSVVRDRDTLLRGAAFLDGVNSGVASVDAYAALRSSVLPLLDTVENAAPAIRRSALFRLFFPESMQVEQVISDTRKLFDLGDIFFAQETSQGEKTYLVLLQNNMELRPTGGFLGSYAKVTLVDGGLRDIKIEDIYVPDGALKGYVKPPAPVEEYLYQSGGWKLRDANWDPDFPTSAETVRWFYEQATHEHVDGIIGTNLGVLQNILDVTGPIPLPDYGKDISSENVYAVVQAETEQNFFPGATNKTAVLGSVWRNLRLTVENMDIGRRLALLHAVIDSLEYGETMIWMEDPNSETKAVSLEWGGKVRSDSAVCFEQNCIADYLYVVESNVGINKTNCCINRTATYGVAVREDGYVETTLLLDYNNTNDVTPNPPISYGGGYLNYLRILKNFSFTSKAFRIGGTTVRNVITERSSDRVVYADGFLVDVPGKEERTVTAMHVSTSPLNLSSEGAYMLFVQKQPGLATNMYDITISLPDGVVFEDGTRVQRAIQPIDRSTSFLFHFKPVE